MARTPAKVTPAQRQIALEGEVERLHNALLATEHRDAGPADAAWSQRRAHIEAELSDAQRRLGNLRAGMPDAFGLDVPEVKKSASRADPAPNAVQAEALVKFAADMAPIIKDFVQRKLEARDQRIAELEARISEIEEFVTHG